MHKKINCCPSFSEEEVAVLLQHDIQSHKKETIKFGLGKTNTFIDTTKKKVVL